MSSKLITGDAAAHAKPFEWRRPPGYSAARPAAPRDAEPAVGDETLRMLRELEAGIPGRERAAFERGAEQGVQKLAAALDQFARMTRDVAAAKSRLRKEAEEDVLRLSVAIARRILHREIQIDGEALLGIIKAALQRIDMRELCRLRVHPAAASSISGAIEALCGAKVTVEPDASLETGAAVFETTRGNLDASVSSQLAEIERGLIEMAARKP